MTFWDSGRSHRPAPCTLSTLNGAPFLVAGFEYLAMAWHAEMNTELLELNKCHH